MPLPPVRAVSFDYGHVLGGLDLPELARRLADGPGGRPDVAGLCAALPAAYAAHDAVIAAGGSHEAAWRALVGALVDAGGSHPTPASREAALDRLWALQPTANLWRDVPAAARDLLDALGRRGVPMVITSNSEGRIRQLLDELGLAHHFAGVLDSGLLGFAKPDPRIFARAVATLGVPAHAVVHVGDSEAADVIGARAAGLRAVRFDGFVPGAAARPTVADARVDTHEALADVLLEALAR